MTRDRLPGKGAGPRADGLRRELPDQTLLLNEHHLVLVPGGYLTHVNRRRPYPSRRQRPPDIERQPVRDAAGRSVPGNLPSRD